MPYNAKNKRNIPDLALSFIFGVLGGAACGIIILSFNSLIGKSGTTGSVYFGAWNWGILGLGLMYGSFFGILIAPFGYLILLRNIGIGKGILPGTIGTILGGCLGAFRGPFEALCFGCFGFFLSLAILRVSYVFKDRSTSSNRE